jgi:hypothetical protein
MRVHHNVCCGIDVHKKSVTACLMWGPADKEPEFEIRRFGTMTRDLQKLAEWLKSDWRLDLPTMVLFESLRTTAFPGHARGDRVYLGSSAVAETNLSQDPHPRPYPFRIHRRRAG